MLKTTQSSSHPHTPRGKALAPSFPSWVHPRWAHPFPQASDVSTAMTPDPYHQHQTRVLTAHLMSPLRHPRASNINVENRTLDITLFIPYHLRELHSMLQPEPGTHMTAPYPFLHIQSISKTQELYGPGARPSSICLAPC